MILREAHSADLDLLWRFLTNAAYETDVEIAKTIPVVASHLAGWRRECDFGFVAEVSNRAVGATWARQFTESENPIFPIDERIPEITIAVEPAFQGRGIGRMLIRSLVMEAERRGIGLCLNVRHDNPALSLYESMGFQRVPGWEVENRAGGRSIGMVLRPLPD